MLEGHADIKDMQDKKRYQSYMSDILFEIIGTPGRIRTCGLRIRSPALYPAELRAQRKLDKKIFDTGFWTKIQGKIILNIVI